MTKTSIPNDSPKICAWCSSAWSVNGEWTKTPPAIEAVSHGICPECRAIEVAKAEKIFAAREKPRQAGAGQGAGRVPDSYRMPFGIHRDKPIGEVPAAYLIWLESQDWIMKHALVYRYIRENKTQLLQEMDAHVKG